MKISYPCEENNYQIKPIKETDILDAMRYMYPEFIKEQTEEWPVYKVTSFIENNLKYHFFIGSITNQIDRITIKIPCSHSWKTYEGFTDRFEYCVHCDEKRR